MQKKYTRWILTGLLAAVALLGSGWLGAQEESFQVIIHPENPQKTLSKSMVSRFFLKKTTRWDNGATVQPVDLAFDSPVRAAFSQEIHKRKPSAIKAYWQQRIFSGRGIPPPEVANDKSALEFVRANREAIAYISARTAADGVQVVEVTE